MSAKRADPWRYAMCNELFEGWSLQKTAAFVGDLGYEGLELAPYSLSDSVYNIDEHDRKRMREEVEGEGIKVVGLHWLLARTEGLQLNDPDPVVRERTARYMLAEVDLCADLGGEVLVLGSPAQRNIRPGFTRDEAWESTVEIMRRLGERAAERGVVFCIEALPPPGCQFITTVDMCAELVRQVGNHEGFQMIADAKQMSKNDARPTPVQIKTVAEHIRHVHANDTNKLGPGMGPTDFVKILRALKEINYRGWISVEPSDREYGIESIAAQSIENLRKVEAAALK